MQTGCCQQYLELHLVSGYHKEKIHGTNFISILTQWVKVKVVHSCLTLCNHATLESMEFSKLEWVAFPFSRASSQPRDGTQVYKHCSQILYQLSHKGGPRTLNLTLLKLLFSMSPHTPILRCSMAEFHYLISVCFILSDILSLQKHIINLSSNTCSLSYWDSHLCVCFYTSLAIVISYFYWIILFPVLKIGDDTNFLMKNLFSCPSVITTISLDFSYYT